jgi:hypothetical protein
VNGIVKLTSTIELDERDMWHVFEKKNSYTIFVGKLEG